MQSDQTAPPRASLFQLFPGSSRTIIPFIVPSSLANLSVSVYLNR